jgi:hypothetical protein
VEATLPSDAADILSARTTSTGYMAVADRGKNPRWIQLGSFSRQVSRQRQASARGEEQNRECRRQDAAEQRMDVRSRVIRTIRVLFLTGR